jgi:feruloyl-CoA synthase
VVERHHDQRAPAFRRQEVALDRRPDGSLRLTSPLPLGSVAPSVGAWLDRWAAEAPGRIAVAERSGTGWRTLTYLELLQQVRAVGGALLGRGLGRGGRIAFLSGNGVDHLVLSLAAQYVGAVAVPIAEQYARLPEAAERLAGVLDKVRPQMAFVAEAAPFARALASPQLAGVEVVAVAPEGAGRPVTAFAALLAGDAAADVDTAHAAVGPATVAKILFTSGSSSAPKGVVTTHGMMCVNQAQVAAAWPFLAERPPRLLDWLPWNHVFGGSKNVNLILAHGGSLYIDDGRPTPAGFARTCDNILANAGTLSFNVPIGYAMLVEAAERDRVLRRRFFSDLDLIFYAGASMAAPVWERLERFALEESGRLPLMASSWGMTETAPACVMVHEPAGRSGIIGVPLPGVEVKLLPDADLRCELRVKGPNVMAGYLDDAERTAAAFDADGFLVTGDAVRFVDPDDPSRGLVFDGRVGEDFKLSTGTWVHVGRLRLDVMQALRGLAADVVVCGHDRSEIGLLVFPDRSLAAGITASDGALADPGLAALVAGRLRALNAEATGSSRRIGRALILAEPPSVAGHEITDKGSLNVANVLKRRAALVERLYDDTDPAVIRP